MAPDPASRQNTDRRQGLLGELAASVPGILFSYWLSADGSERSFPYISSRVSDVLDVTLDQLKEDATVLNSQLHPDEADGLRPSILESARTLAPWQFQARVRTKDGSYRWFEGHSVPRRLKDGSTLWFGQFTDIQEHKELEFELRASEAEAGYQLRFHQLLASLSSDFINSPIGNIDQQIDQFLARIGEFFGVDRVYVYRFSGNFGQMTNTHEWCGAGVAALKDSQQAVDISGFQWWQRQIRELFYHNQVVFLGDVDRLPAHAVEERALLQEQGVAAMFCTPLKVRGTIEGFFGMDSMTVRQWRTDLSDLLILIANLLSQALERFRLEQELLHQSTLDPLTGIHNRRYLEPRVEEMLSHYERSGQGVALAMLDIDHFKQVNDTHGHQAGDEVLQAFAALLRDQCRGEDVAARYGGEEFVVALANVLPDEAASAITRLLELVREAKICFNGTPIPISASAGLVHVADLKRDKLSRDAMITEADRRLYRAKRNGRDCLVDGFGAQRT